jgi:diguanylate cyclase (GGDEF) domain
MTLVPPATNLNVLVAILIVLGIFFALAFVHDRRQRCHLSWMATYLLGAVGAGLISLRGTIPDSLSIGVSNGLLLLGIGVFWTGVRQFEGRPGLPLVALVPAAGWTISCLEPVFFDSITLRLAYMAASVMVFSTLCVTEFWTARAREPLFSRGPAMALFVAHGLLHAGVLLAAVLRPDLFGREPQDSQVFHFMVFERVIQVVAVGVLMISLGKERAEREQHRAAMTDVLTGLANRRAFVDRMKGELAAGRGGALILLDIDLFKRINDSFGHICGDRALVVFARILEIHAGAGSVIGRIGGEEFACFLPGRTAGEAAAVADNLRRTVAAVEIEAEGHRFRMTVSGGVAAAAAGEGGLDRMLARTDAALYRAKSGGRDRIEIDAEAPRRADVNQTLATGV